VVTVEAAGETVAVVADSAPDPHPARARTLPDSNAALRRCSWVIGLIIVSSTLRATARLVTEKSSQTRPRR
jgi:hypothetical protein